MAESGYRTELSAGDERRNDALLNPAFTALLFAQGAFGFSFSSFLLLPKFLVVQLGAGPFEIGVLMAVYGVGVIAAVPAMGSAVDRWGRRDFLTAGGLLMAVSSLGFVYVEQAGFVLYALRAVQAVAFAMAYAAGAALTVDHASPARLSQAIGVFGLSFLSMNAVAPAAVEWTIAHASWSVAFVAAAGSAVLSALLSRRVPDVHRPDGADPPVSLWAVIRRPRLARLMIVVALLGTAMSAVFIYHQPYALLLGMDDLKSFFIAYAAAAFFVRGVLGSLADRVGAHRVAIGALALYVVVTTTMVGLEPGMLPLFGAGLGIAHGFGYPALNALAAEGVGESERGKVMALFQAAFNVGFAGVAFGLGVLADYQGYPPVFLAGGLAALAGLVLLVNSPEGRGRAT